MNYALNKDYALCTMNYALNKDYALCTMNYALNKDYVLNYSLSFSELPAPVPLYLERVVLTL